MLTTILATTGTALAAIFLVPQLLRLVRRRDARGVSVLWAVFGVVTNAIWVGYLASQQLWLAAAAPALAVASYGAVLVVVARLDHGQRYVSLTLAYLAAFATAYALGGTIGLALLLAVSPAVQLAPQVATTYRTARPRGVSTTTWMLTAAEAGSWGLYGLLVADLALVGYGAVTGVAALAIVARCLATTSRPHPGLLRHDRSVLAVT